MPTILPVFFCSFLVILHKVFTPTRNMQHSRHVWQKQGTRKYVKEQEDRYMAVAESHTLDGANTITLIIHNHRWVVLVKSLRMDGAITVVII